MVVDYSNHKPVNKNRPRKQPGGIFVFILLVAIAISFAFGTATGWFLHKPSVKVAQNQQTVQPIAGSEVNKGQPVLPEATASPGTDAPLTFYETLPKGGKAIIGSGLNPQRNQNDPPPAPLPTMSQVPVQKQPVAAIPLKPQESKDLQKVASRPAGQQAVAASVQASPDQSTVQKPLDRTGKFCVQIASTKEREEAEALSARLSSKGLPVYVLESTVEGRGTWYRIRAGRHLSKEAAAELAAKAGSGAIAVPE